jgi:uncharacterized protein (DUF433 family)
MDLIDVQTGAPNRFTTPLYTVAEGARYLRVPASTLSSWSHGYTRRRAGETITAGKPILTTVPRDGAHRKPTIPFIGLAEGLVLAAMRRSGVALQRIRPALARLDDEVGLQHALASKRLYTDGVEVLYDYATAGADDETSVALRELVVVRSGQHVLNEVVSAYLRRLDFGEDGYAQLIRLPGYEAAEVLVDPTRGFGQPIFSRGGARVEDALSMFQSGEDLDTVAAEYRIPREQLEDVVRVATMHAA